MPNKKTTKNTNEFEPQKSENDKKDELNQRYSENFVNSNGVPLPQPGILPPQLSDMGFIFIKLKKEFHDEKKRAQICNLLASVENIQTPPYYSSNARRYPSSNNTLNDNYESMLIYAQRTSNLLPSNVLHISFGFGFQLWKDWGQIPPNGFIKFEPKINNQDTESRKPFENNKQSEYYKNHFVIEADKGKREYDIIMQIKSASKKLINRVFAHGLQLFNGLCENIQFKIGVCKQRNQFGFYDAASEASHTANPTLPVGPVNRAWNDTTGLKATNGDVRSAVKNYSDVKAKQHKYGDQYIDQGRYNTVLIGKEESRDQFKNGTFGVFCEFVHDLHGFNQLSIDNQNQVFGREKDSGAFISVPDSNGSDPLSGSINHYVPRAHIVRTHIRGISKLQCPMKTLHKLSEDDKKHTFLFPDREQNTTNKYGDLAPSIVPMQMYRQAASFDICKPDGTHTKGLHFFGYARDCHLIDDIFNRMIGKTSTLQDVPEKDNNDQPFEGGMYQVDSLLQYTRGIGASYYYFPNFNHLLSLATWPQTNFGNKIIDPKINKHMKQIIFEKGMNSLNWDLGEYSNQQYRQHNRRRRRPPRRPQHRHPNWGVDIVADICEFFGLLRFPPSYDGGFVNEEDRKSKNDSKTQNSNETYGKMQSDPLKDFMLNICQTSIEVEWNRINGVPVDGGDDEKDGGREGVAVPVEKHNQVIIVGGGIAGLVCGYELKKVGFNVKIIEKSNKVGGRVNTFHFSNGVHAEAGAMRLPGDADPTKRHVSHWLTDFYIDLFNLEVSPFHNDDPNTLIKILDEHVYKQREWSKSTAEGGKAAEIETKLWFGWNKYIEENKTKINKWLRNHANDEKSEKYKAYEKQLEILNSIETIEDYYSSTTNVITNQLTSLLNQAYDEEGDTIERYNLAIKAWDFWVRKWSKFSGTDFLRTDHKDRYGKKKHDKQKHNSQDDLEDKKMEMDDLDDDADEQNSGQMDEMNEMEPKLYNIVEKVNKFYDIKFMGLRPWPEVAIRGLLIVQYMPSFQSASLVELLRDSFGDWWQDPMHTLTDGMDILPRSFVNQNLWGPQSKSNSQWRLTNDIIYGESVYKIDYSEQDKPAPHTNYPNTKNPTTRKCVVYSKNTQSGIEKSYECDYVIVTTPLPVIQNIQFVPSLSSFKQEAIRMTRYESSTKVLLQFKKRFWEYDVFTNQENEDSISPKFLSKDDIILGGLSYSTQTSSQIVYPTPKQYQFRQDEYVPYVDWSYCDSTHIDDCMDRGVLVSYTWGYEAQRIASLEEHEAIRIVLDQIATLHSEARFPGKDEKSIKNRDDYKRRIKDLFEHGKRMAWSTNKDMGGGAFVLFGPFNYLDYWKDLITVPEGSIKLNQYYNDSENTDKQGLKRSLQELKKKIQEPSPERMNKSKKQFFKKKANEIEKAIDTIDFNRDDDKKLLLLLKRELKHFDRWQNKRLYFAGEGISWTNGWIQGAMESSIRVVYQLFENYQMQYNNDYSGVSPQTKRKSIFNQLSKFKGSDTVTTIATEKSAN